jgi:hypothetical protein
VGAGAGLSGKVLSKPSEAGTASRVLAEEEKVSIDETHAEILSFLAAFFRKTEFLHVILSPHLEPEVVLVIARPWRLA